MKLDEEKIVTIANAFSAAALGIESWTNGLTMLADATGSRCGELIGLGHANAVPFNIVSDMDPAWADDFAAAGGGDPSINPFVKAGTDCPVGAILASADFLSVEERRRNPFIQEHANTHDFPYICLTPLVKTREMLIGLAVMRSKTQGEISAGPKRVFSYLSSCVRSAVKSQTILDHQHVLAAVGALGAARITAFLCTENGKVKSMTSGAEEFIRTNELIDVRNGTLTCMNHRLARLLADKIRAMSHYSVAVPRTPLDQPIPVTTLDGKQLIIEVVPVPRNEIVLQFDPGAIVIVRHTKPPADHIAAVLRSSYDLSTAEVDVCLKLANGMAVGHIAKARGSSVETVRKQLKSVFDKLGTHKQSELVRLINNFG